MEGYPLKPTKTINKLHFEDLSPSRFEDLSLAIVYRLNRWLEINHYGRSGNDEGIDILAIQELENNFCKTWFIQCKRYKKITKQELRAIVDKIISRNAPLPDILLLIIACDVRKNNIEYFKKYANEKGICRSIIWTASILETKLYSEHHDLLFAYFGISLTAEKRGRISTIRRNIRLKQRMRKDFISKSMDPHETIKRPYKKFKCLGVIIHSIDDTYYPEVDENDVGISSWFKVELYDFYHNGLEVTLGIVEGIFDKNDNWDIIHYGEPKRKGNYRKENLFMIGRIPYESIIEYDLEGDEFYNCPHIYCDFKNNGEPYEEIVYSIISKESDKGYTYDYRLDNEKRKKLK